MKKIISIAATIAVATLNIVVSGNNNNELSDLQIENIEALASGESYQNAHPCRWNSYYLDCYNRASGSVCLNLDKNCQ